VRSSRLSAAAQQITDNVLERFGATPYVPDPVRAQCVQLRAMSNTSGNSSWASAGEIDLLGGDGRELAKTQWTISADSEETTAANNAAVNAIDGNVNTLWHSAYSSSLPALPHTLTINLGATLDVSALRYLPRQDGTLNGTIGSYEVWITENCAAPSWTRVAQGTWLETPIANAGRKTARLRR
jgi:galactose oxidase